MAETALDDMNGPSLAPILLVNEEAPHHGPAVELVLAALLVCIVVWICLIALR